MAIHGPLLPVDKKHLFSYQVLFSKKQNMLHYITNLRNIEQLTDTEQLTDYSNLSKVQFQC